MDENVDIVRMSPERERLFNRKFQILNGRLRDCEIAKKIFIAEYPEWELLRIETINLLYSLAKHLDKTHFNCNVAKSVATTADLLNSSVGLYGAAEQAVGARTIHPAAHVLFSLICTTVNAGTASAEVGISSGVLKKARAKIKEDQKKFDELMKWRDTCLQVQEASTGLCDVSVLGSIVRDLVAIGGEVAGLSLDCKPLMEELIKKAGALVGRPLNSELASEVTTLVSFALQSGKSIQTLKTVDEIVQRSPHLLTAAHVSISAFCNYKEIAQCGALKSSYSKDTAFEYGMYEAVKIAANLVSLHYISKDMEKGSISQFSGNVKTAAEELSAELGLLKQMFKEMTQS